MKDSPEGTDAVPMYQTIPYIPIAPLQPEPMYEEVPPNTNRYGWVCPKCDRVHAPDVEQCYRCNGR